MSLPGMDPTALTHILVTALTGVNASKYLSTAGVVVLLYDHMLLLSEEVEMVWLAKWSWTKGLFLFNRYFTPVCMVAAIYQISGISPVSQPVCKSWLASMVPLEVISLAVANVFVIQRVYALWDYRKRVLQVLVALFMIMYICMIGIAVWASRVSYLEISYNRVFNICSLEKRPVIYISLFAVPALFDVILFGITYWNALDRPRRLNSTVAKQLFRDGVLYFLVTLALRIFNAIILAVADLAYIQLGLYFIWSIIIITINRMLLTVGRTVATTEYITMSGDSKSLSPSGVPIITTTVEHHPDSLEYP